MSNEPDWEAMPKDLLETVIRISCFYDLDANEWLAKFGTYSAFDEPVSVSIARAAITRVQSLMEKKT